MRRVASELADVEQRARGGRGRLARPRGAGAVSGRPSIGLTGPIGCGKTHRRRLAAADRAPSVIDADVDGPRGDGARPAGPRRILEPVRGQRPDARRHARPGGARPDRLQRPAAPGRARGDRPPAVRPRILAAIDAGAAGRRAGGRRRGDQARRGRPGGALRRGLARTCTRRPSASGSSTAAPTPPTPIAGSPLRPASPPASGRRRAASSTRRDPSRDARARVMSAWDDAVSSVSLRTYDPR